MSNDSEYLFVYGTLCKKAHQSKCSFLEGDAQYMGDAETTGTLFLVDDYPALIFSPDGNKVQGELYKIRHSSSLFKRLDHYEGCSEEFLEPTEYVRAIRPVIHSSETYTAWLYLYNLPTHQLRKIESGSFPEFSHLPQLTKTLRE